MPAHRLHRPSAPASTVVWNTVVPLLGIALIVGAPMLAAIGIAVVVAVAIHVALAPRPAVRLARHRVLRVL